MKAIFYDWAGYNAEIFYAINSLGNSTTDLMMVAISMFGRPQMFFIYIVMIMAYARHDLHKPVSLVSKDAWYKTIIVLISAYIVDIIWVRLLKLYFYMPRPFIHLPTDKVKQLDIESDYSTFPSGHTCFAMLMVACLWPILGRTGKIIAVLYLLTIAMSRIVLGVHFPADVTISAILSLISVCIVRKIVEKFLARKKA